MVLLSAQPLVAVAAVVLLLALSCSSFVLLLLLLPGCGCWRSCCEISRELHWQVHRGMVLRRPVGAGLGGGGGDGLGGVGAILSEV